MPKTIRVRQDFIIERCINECPFFDYEGMERVMVCNHPTFRNSDDPYAGWIISRDIGDGFPEKCPINDEEVLLWPI
jgi:hypothetical protein